MTNIGVEPALKRAAPVAGLRIDPEALSCGEAAARIYLGDLTEEDLGQDSAGDHARRLVEEVAWAGIPTAGAVVHVVLRELRHAGFEPSSATDFPRGRTLLRLAREALKSRPDPEPRPEPDPVDLAQADADAHVEGWTAEHRGAPQAKRLEAACGLATVLVARHALSGEMAALVVAVAFERAKVGLGEGGLWEIEQTLGVPAARDAARARRRRREAEEDAGADAFAAAEALEAERCARSDAFDWAKAIAGEMLDTEPALSAEPPGVLANRLVVKAQGGLELDDARLAAAAAYRVRGISVDTVGGAQPVVTRAPGRPLESTWFDSCVEMKAPRWLVKGLFTSEGLGLLFGESGAGKSFLAVHLALCVAYGLPFFDRKVRQGGVAFFAAEGGAGVGKRFYAAEKALAPQIEEENHKRAKAGEPALRRAKIMIVREAPNLSRTGEPERVVATLAQAKAEMAAVGEPLSLAILDTWHAAMGGGEENAAEDVGEALKTLRPASCDMQVLVVHHPGKISERGPRGSNALPAAADTVVELTVPGCEGLKSKAGADRKATLSKLREGETGATFAYQLPAMELALDDDGEPWTTCYVRPVKIAAPVVLANAGDKEFDAIFDRCQEAGRAHMNRLREEYLGARPQRDTAYKALKRALERAAAQGRYVSDQKAMVVYRAE